MDLLKVLFKARVVRAIELSSYNSVYAVSEGLIAAVLGYISQRWILRIIE